MSRPAPAEPAAPPHPADELLRLARRTVALLSELAAHYEVGRLGPPAQAVTITRPQDVADYLGPELVDLAQEQLRVVLLDRRCRVVATPLVYQGGVGGIDVRLAECFREAVRANASSVIFCHNHPSGDPTPSPDDIAISRQAVLAGKLLGIDVLDHMVLAREGNVSLRERDLMPAAASRPA